MGHGAGEDYGVGTVRAEGWVGASRCVQVENTAGSQSPSQGGARHTGGGQGGQCEMDLHSPSLT